jgi:hypothetical protein
MGNQLTAKRTKPTASDTAVAVRVVRSGKSKRRAARENPQAYPEVSNRQLARDLEDNSLDGDD